MSQGRATSRTSAVGELADDDEVRYIFSQRRKAGGKLEYLCKVASGEPDGLGGSECRNEWLKPSDIKGPILAEWEVANSRRLEEEKYKDTSNKRRAARDQVATMRVASGPLQGLGGGQAHAVAYLRDARGCCTEPPRRLRGCV